MLGIMKLGIMPLMHASCCCVVDLKLYCPERI